MIGSAMRPWVKFLMVIAVCVAAYGSTLRNGFVWDDQDAIVDNWLVKQWSNVPQLFTRDYFLRAYELSYRPLVTLTYFADYSLWKLNPAGYHLSNVLVHLLAALAWFALLRRLAGDGPVSLTAALLFACHPVLTEAVNVVAFREDIMAGLSVFLALLAYVRFCEAPGARRALWYGLSLLCYFIAMMSKEMGATVPALIAMHDLWLGRRRWPLRGERGRASWPWRRFLLRGLVVYGGFLLVLGLYLLVRFDIMLNPRENTTGRLGGSLAATLITAPRVIATYVKLMVLPLGLSAHYQTTPSRSLLDTDVLLSLALIAGCLVYAWRRLADDRPTAFAGFAFFVLLLPVSNIIPIVNPVAERYLYLPAAAFSLAAAGVLSRHRAPVWAVPAILAVFVGLANLRNADWRSSETIWSKTARRFPDSADIHHELGDIRHRQGRTLDAIEEYKKALTLNPSHLAVRVNLGVCYDELGDLDQALAQYRMAIAINPTISKIHNNIGNVCFKKGLFDEAIAAYQEAIRLHPHYPEPHHNLSVAYERTGKMDEAVAAARREAAIATDRADSWINLARLLLRRGDEREALEILGRLKAQGAAVPAHLLLAEYRASRGERTAAIEEYRRLLERAPEEGQAHLGLAGLYEETGDPAAAIACYERAAAASNAPPAVTARATERLAALKNPAPNSK